MQIYILMALITFIAIILFVDKFINLKRKRSKKVMIAETFGNKSRNETLDCNLLEQDWITFSRKISDKDQIDDVTWFDLEMDQLFCEINNCKSFAGDQILYSILHIIGNHDKEYTAFHEKIDFFDKEEADRNEIWYIISGLGKQTDSYYLPFFINNLELFRIPHIEYYRFMRIFLFVSFIPAIVFTNYIYLMIPFFVALINIVIYAFQKNKYGAVK